jgi:hypothetical protein
VLSDAVKELQQRKNQIANQIASLRGEAKKIGEAIKALSRLSGVAAASVKPAKRKMSAAGRKAIAKAQKARWAKVNKAAAKAKPAKKRKMSAASRKKISAAMKARWAKIKAAKQK